jgi:hypothetical protein
MTRRGPGRLPGDPRSGDRDFGALGGFVDDVSYWEADLERSAELEMRRLATAARRTPGDATTPRGSLVAAGSAVIRRLVRRVR